MLVVESPQCNVGPGFNLQSLNVGRGAANLTDFISKIFMRHFFCNDNVDDSYSFKGLIKSMNMDLHRWVKPKLKFYITSLL